MATQVFISYCQEDAASANRICGALEGDEITCWIAPRNVPPGQEWPVAIAGGIRSSRILVLLLSSHSHRSKQIARECELADRNGLSIVTFRLEEIDPPEALEYFLTNLQWIDGFGSNFDTGMATLVHTIRWRLSLPEPAPGVPRSRPVVATSPANPTHRSKKRKIWIAAAVVIGILGLISYAVDESNRTHMYVPPEMARTNTEPSSNVSTQPDSDDVSPQPAAPAPRQTAAGELIAGNWAGTYYCNGMGLNQMQLIISPAGGNEVNAVMQFAVPTGTPGAYDMHGSIEPGTNMISLAFTKWRYVPPGVWSPANLQGEVDTMNGVIKGRVLSPPCGGFEVHRQ